MDELKMAWENFLADSEQEKLLEVVRKNIPDDFDPGYELSDEWFIETMKVPFLASHRICDVELCGKAFRVSRTSDEAEKLSILPCKSPSLNEPGVSYFLTGEPLQQFIHGKQQALEDEDAKWQAEIEERNRPDPVPVCSSIIRFIPTENRFDCCGEVILKAKEVREYLEDEARERIEYGLKQNIEDYYKPSEVLPWTTTANETLTSETLVPKQWKDKFQHISYGIFEKKKGSVWCLQCKQIYKGEELRNDVDPYPHGMINGRFFCPDDHNVFEIELMRVF